MLVNRHKLETEAEKECESSYQALFHSTAAAVRRTKVFLELIPSEIPFLLVCITMVIQYKLYEHVQ